MKNITWEPKEVYTFAETWATNQTQYCGWISARKVLELRVWAFRRTKKSGLEVREVIRARSDREGVIIRNMYLTAMCGWKVFFKPGDHKSSGWYGYTYYECHKEDFEKWEEYTEVPGVYYKIINPEDLKGTRFEFCGYTGGEIIKYIKLWEKHPCVEYFGKNHMTPSKAIINKIEKDRAFGKWLAKQDKEELQEYRAQAILYAYTHHKTLCEAKAICTEKNEAVQLCKRYEAINRSGLDKIKIYRYITKSNVRIGQYNDYLDACQNLGLDLNDTKNAFPKEFRRMHDLRTNEWGAKKMKTRAKDFKAAAAKYKPFEFKEGAFAILIPEQIQDLKHEGSKLHHCVGNMGYDLKMIKGQSFIAFLRKSEEEENPFVTIEFDLKGKHISQIYGKHDSEPPKDARDFAKEWERRVQKWMTTTCSG